MVLERVVVGLGLAGALAVGQRGAAQVSESWSLTVRVPEMLTATQNPAAGVYPLAPDSSALVTVPPQCAGAHRCPLIVALPWGGGTGIATVGSMRPTTDKYGMILLALTDYDVPLAVDEVLQDAFQRFAIDPTKIVMLGNCASASAAAQYGEQNLNVFSRIVLINGLASSVDGWDPQGDSVEVFLGNAFEGAGSMYPAFHWLQQAKVPFKATASFRDHGNQHEELDLMGRWLQESWRVPPAARTAPQVVADSLTLPVLTTKALASLTTFWIHFRQQPESIRTTARRAHVREVLVPAGDFRPSTMMVDMAALATESAPVAAALRAAGLTAKDHDAYRIALLSARLAADAKAEGAIVPENSTLAKNIAFLEAHPDEVQQLTDAGMWAAP